MEQGWIMLYRSLREHWIWEDPIKLKWWLDILLQANHQDRKFLLGNELIEVKRGSFHTSEVKLAERWKVDRKTVRKFLELLKTDNMVTLEKNKKGTTLNISNYKALQGFSEGQKDNAVDNGMDNSVDNKVPTQWTTPSTDKSQISGQISPNKVDTNNNDNNVNNDNKYMSDSNEYRLAEYLFKYIKSNNPKTKKPNMQTWAKDFDKILRIDSRDLEEVKELIAFSQKHDFWCSNMIGF